jgi:hypothetical protein
MTTEHGHEEPAAELEHQSQELDEIEASIAALEKAMLRPRVRDREAIHELGCTIVAQAVMNNK